MKANLLLIFTVFHIGFGLLGQNASIDDVNLQKYWYYRWRLTNDFVKVGEGRGHSLPIQSRQGYPGIPDVEAADATIYQGFYLGVLATEFKLLSINNRHADLEYTKTELYYAIKAFERLDYYGEAYLGFTPKIDGYFQRDDFDCDFWNPNVNPDNYEHFNQFRHIPKDFIPVYKVFTSDDCPTGKPIPDKSNPKTTPSMSQDQVIFLLMGFSLIDKCVEGEHTVRLHNGQVVLYNFREQAKRHLTNMINYCRHKYPEKPEKVSWRIHRPDGKKVHPGQNVFMFKYPMSVIGANSYTPLAENNQVFKKARGNAHWQLTRIWIPYKNVNGHMITILAAVSGKWGKNEERTIRSIQHAWRKRNWEHFYVPLLAVLHDVNIENLGLEEGIARDIAMAPAVGPYNFTRDEIAQFADSIRIPQYTVGWTRHLKYSSRVADQMNGDLDNYMRRGFYSGLDFMLLFNLYYLTTSKALPLYQNLIHRHVRAADSPISPRNERMLGAFSTLTISDIKILDSLSHIRAGDDFQVVQSGLGKSSPALLMRIEPFNPWDPENFEKNYYGWQETFPKKQHVPAKQKNAELNRSKQ